MAQRDDIHELARGRWRAILMAAGFKESHLTGKHGPCPFCDGTDRWRWTNRDNSGAAICNVCGPKTGVDLVMMKRGVEFLAAKKWIMEEIGKAPIETKPKRSNEKILQRMSKLWSEASPLDGKNPASLYLLKRGIKLDEYPKLLRYHPRVAYEKDGDNWVFHPALLSKFVSPDAKTWTLHKTFVDSDGNKAPLPPDEVRKFVKEAPIPLGGAVRLANSAETMGVATGLETSLSAGMIFNVPMWATLNDGLLVKFEPPPTVKCLLIFGDCDSMFGGQYAAYALAHKLAAKKKIHVEVRIPPELDTDWDDVRAADMEFA